MYNGFHPKTIQDWKNYCNSDTEYSFARIHPKFKQTDSIQEHLNFFAQSTKKVIVLYPDHQTKFLSISNNFNKTGKEYLEDRIDFNEIYNHWPVAAGTPTSDIPRWILREFLSYYMIPAWTDEHEFFLPENVKCDTCLWVSVSDLLFDFKTTVTKILEYTELDYYKTTEELISSHALMMSKQQNLPMDKLVEDILTNFECDVDYQWKSLDLPMESYIQWELRNRGYSLLCQDLNVFPTDIKSLKSICYQ